MLFLPVVAFNSTRANLDSGTLWNLIAGGADSNFILDTTTADLLNEGRCQCVAIAGIGP
jgi:hypothetical protein